MGFGEWLEEDPQGRFCMLIRMNYTRNGHDWNPMPDMELTSLRVVRICVRGFAKRGFGRTPRPLWLRHGWQTVLLGGMFCLYQFAWQCVQLKDIAICRVVEHDQSGGATSTAIVIPIFLDCPKKFRLRPLCGYEKADFTRTGRSIVQSSSLAFFYSTRGYIAMKLHTTYLL